jgi:hypothetical protein
MKTPMLAVIVAALFFVAAIAADESLGQAEVIAATDIEYQAAVERNDWRTMDRILHPEFRLVLGNGMTHTKAELPHRASDLRPRTSIGHPGWWVSSPRFIPAAPTACQRE